MDTDEKGQVVNEADPVKRQELVKAVGKRSVNE
jgi:hypothetical protein